MYYRYPAAGGGQDSFISDIDFPRENYKFYIDFVGDISGTSVTNSMYQFAGGGGSAGVSGAYSFPGHPGLCTVNSGSTTYASVSTSANALQLGGGRWWFETDLLIPTLSNATNEYALLTGFVGTTSSLTQTNAIAFLYDRSGASTGSTASDNWQILTAVANTRTYVPTSIAVANNTWYRLGVMVNADTTEAEYFINGTSVGTISSTFPITTTFMGFQGQVRRVAGTGGQVVFDYFNVVGELAASR